MGWRILSPHHPFVFSEQPEAIYVERITAPYLILTYKPEQSCKMIEVLEHEDEHGYIWYDHWECSECGGKTNGNLVSVDQISPPRYCPNCGRKVVDA